MIKKKVIPTIFVFLLIGMLLTSPVNAWILEQHVNQNKQALSQTTNSPITQEILRYEDYYHLADLLTDISVVSYFTIDIDEGDNFFEKLFKTFTFRIGKTYRATHAQLACSRALSVAENEKERVMGYGICSHLVQDFVAHNQAVPQAIKNTKLFNGLIHSVKEIHDKNLMSTEADRVYSRQVLDLAYEEEVMDYFERVFVQDPAFSKVNIRNLIDFFVSQVQPESEYRLGFRSFFALPTYIYWVILILFLLSVVTFGSSVRLIKDGERNMPTFFTTGFSLVLLIVVSLAIYGLFTSNLWSIWEVLSQFLFSPSMYFVGGAFLIMGGFIGFKYIRTPNKVKNIPNLLVAVFILSIGMYFLTLPTGLTIGNEQALHDLSITHTKNLLNQGVNYITNPSVGDPVGYVALKEANSSGSLARTGVILYLLGLLGSILFFTFKRRKG